MDNRNIILISGAAAAVLLALIGLQMVQTKRANTRIDDLEQQIADLETAPAPAETRVVRLDTRPVRGSESSFPAVVSVDPEDPESVALVEEIVAEVSQQQHEERRARREEIMQEALRSRVDEVASWAELDDETHERVIELVQSSMIERRELREAAMNGEISYDEMRTQSTQIREETEQALIALVGDDLYQEIGGDEFMFRPGPPR